MIKTYRKKPVEVKAIQWKGHNYEECAKFIGIDLITNRLSVSGELISTKLHFGARVKITDTTTTEMGNIISVHLGNDYPYTVMSDSGATKDYNQSEIEVIMPITLYIHSLDGEMEVKLCDYIIRGIKGEIYPCKPDIFEATYEQVDN